jgi:2-polyprenyl-6-methoxyphenol hydroxylase-like FAD-dependent oxidoreductase
VRTPVEVPVLIVGGGPIGMLTAVGLRHFGIDCMLVERHASTLDFPKGRRVNTRTVEIFRQWGLEAAVADASLPRADSLYVFEGETLLGADFQRRGLPVDQANPASPTRELICSQESLEPLLRARALDDGADLRFLTELVGFSQDDDGVTAEIVTRGEPRSVRASYLVAADGGRGRMRDALGIGRSDPGVFGSRLSILVEADIETRMKERQSAIYWLGQPRPGSLFLAVDNKDRWLCVVPHDPDTEPTASLTPQRCLELVRGGLGDDAVEVRYLDHRIWEPTALVADRFRSGRVFLAGDAAHVTTPEGGLGMNCGVADAHNLAWKLAGVLAGWADPALLDSYESERRPHAAACVNASLGPARPPNPIDGLVLGHTYESAAIVSDHTLPPSTRDPIGEYRPVGRPGHRAPHFWLDDGRSTLDLFGVSFVALTDSAGERSLDDVTDVARAAGIPLAVHAINDTSWRHLYGLEPGGVVLVRPDGYVAWRSIGSSASPDLAAAIGIAAGHNQSRADGRGGVH